VIKVTQHGAPVGTKTGAAEFGRSKTNLYLNQFVID
jgi:hypothetical protein